MAQRAMLVPIILASSWCLTTTGCQTEFGDVELLPDVLPVAYEDYCLQYADTACEAAARCGCLDIYDLEMCQAFQQAECTVKVQEPCESGRRSYDSQQAALCLHQLSNEMADCTATDIALLPGCDAMLVGQVPAGARCYRDVDCASGLECFAQACVAMPAAGEPCLPAKRCARGQFCDQQQLCQLEREHGEPCPEGDRACADELYCDVRVQQCAPYLQVGESCAHKRAQCDEGLYCDRDSICQLQNQPAAGCGNGTECSADGCPAGECGWGQSVCTFLPVADG